MTADQRLDQLEPLVAQTLAVVDRHTAQLKQLVSLVTRQSDNMQFALRELLEVKGELGEVKGELGEVKSELGEVKGELGEVKAKQDLMDTKLDRIIDLLGAGGQ